MKQAFFVWAVCLVAIVCTVGKVQAVSVLYEPFNYTAGQGLAGVNGQVATVSASGNGATTVVPAPQGGSALPYGQQAPNGNYWMTAGHTVTGANPFSNSPYDQTKDAVTVATDLSVSGLADSGGGSIQLGGTGSTPRLAFTPFFNDAGGAPVNAYYSLLVQINDISSTQALGGVIGGFNNIRGVQGNNPSTCGASLWVKASGGGFVFGVAEQSINANNSPVYDTTVQSFGQAYLIVGKYTIRGTLNSGTSDDTAQIWINPASSTFGGADPAGALVASINNTDVPTNQTDPAGGNPTIQTFIFRQDGAVGANSPTDYYIDDLRVGTTYADVTPAAVVGLPGDFNSDTKVDAADYATWRRNEVANATLPNDNGLGNQADRYALWRANFGNGGPGGGSGLGGASVPEPMSSLLLLGLAWPYISLRRTRK